jgi:type IV secretory pathway VirB4 component
MVPVLGAECGSPDGIPLFFGAGRSLVNFDPTDPEALNYLITVVGAQGSGKTMLVAALLQGMLAWGARGYIVDRADHYLPLVQLVGGAHFKLGAGANRHRICPWDIPDPAQVPDEHVEFLIALHAALIGRKDRGEPLESIEEGLLDTAIRDNYQRTASDTGWRGRELGLRRILEQRAAQDRATGAGERAAVAEHHAARREQ